MADLPTREVHISSNRRYVFGDFQLNYLDYRNRRLIPSSRVLQDRVLLYKTNAAGCIGEELVPDVPVIGFFGDSCTHGYCSESFVQHVKVPGYQALNAGIEGLTLPWVIDRFLEISGRVPLAAAVVHSGWHNVAYNDRTEDFWAAHFDRVAGPPVIAHYRLVGDINDDAIRLGYDAIFTGRDNYGPWSGFDYKSEAGRRGFTEDIARFNRFIEAYCKDRGRVLIDLEPATYPRTHEDLGRAFLDFIHPSPAAYPAMARTIEQSLAAPLAAASHANQP